MLFQMTAGDSCFPEKSVGASGFTLKESFLLITFKLLHLPIAYMNFPVIYPN